MTLMGMELLRIIEATKDTFSRLTTNEINDKLINEYNIVGGIGGGGGAAAGGGAAGAGRV